MAVVLQEIVDSDFEYFVKITTTGTNSAASVFDASDAEGASTDPRTSITGVAWSVAAQTDILWDATSNVVAIGSIADRGIATIQAISSASAAGSVFLKGTSTKNE